MLTSTAALGLAVVVAAAAAPADAPPVNAGAVTTTPAAPKTRALLVLDLTSGSGVDAATLSTITNMLAVSVQKRPHLNVLTGQDVKRMAQVEADKQVLGCDPTSSSCIAEIAGAMGADLVLYGDVGKLGDLYVISLNLFDAGQAKSVGRQPVNVRSFDEQFLAQLDIAVRQLLAPVTGESTGVTLAPTAGAAVPTIDLEALKSSGLKAINMKAEAALEAALDAQEDASATPERKRDTWCALARVEGANPYLEPASKACSEWEQYVVANRDLEKNMSADYQTLAGFLALKRKTKEQKLEAIDSFLKSYERLTARPMVQSVQKARARLVSSGTTSLDDKDSDGLMDDVDRCVNEAEDFDNYRDDDGCLEADNDDDGIKDAEDTCPQERGVREKAGCPETIGDVAAGAASATGNFIGDTVDLFMFDMEREPFFGLTGTVESGVVPLGNPMIPGFGFRLSWAPIEAGMRYTFNVSKPDGADAFFIWSGNVGLQGLQIPKGDFGLLRPSVGVDGGFSFDDAAGYTAGAYLANTFVLFILQVRVYYRYELSADGLLASDIPEHLVGLELALDMIKLFEEP